MKRIYFYSIISLLILSAGACTDDFLEAEQLTEVNDENFYSTPNDAYSALVGCYDGLQRASGGVAGLSYPVDGVI